MTQPVDTVPQVGHNTEAGGSGKHTPQNMDHEAREDLAYVVNDVIFRLQQANRKDEALTLEFALEDALPYEDDLMKLAFWVEQEFCGLYY